MIELDVNTDVNGVILAGNIGHRPDGAVNRRVKSVVILWCKAKNDECASYIPFRLVLVRITKEPRNSKLAAFDPKFCGFASCRERHEPAICPAHETIRVLGCLDRPRIWFQFPCEKPTKTS
jgi:hypothetical protein